MLLTFLLCAALLAACGGSDDGSPGAGGRDEPAGSDSQRFVADGDKLCRRLAERYPHVREERRGTDTAPAAVFKAASTYRAFTRELSSGLAALDRPNDEKAKQILSLSSRLASRALEQTLLQKKVVDVRQRGDLQAAFRAALPAARAEQRMIDDVAEPLDARMRSYGFKVCGRERAETAHRHSR